MSFSIDFILDGKNILYRVNLKYKKEKINLENESYIETLDKIESNNEVMDVKVFENVLKTLDSSIEKVRKLDEVKNAYILTLKGEDLIIQDGEFIKK